MNPVNKKILVYFIVLGIIFTSVIIYKNYSFGNELFPRYDFGDILDKNPTTLIINYTKIADVERKQLFSTMANVEDYPLILPRNHVSAIILEQDENVILTEQKVTEAGIDITLRVRHTIYPYDRQIIDVLDGGANGSKIELIFEDYNKNSTKISANIEMRLGGILKFFSLLSDQNLKSAVNTVFNDFIDYAKNNPS